MDMRRKDREVTDLTQIEDILNTVIDVSVHMRKELAHMG